MTEPRIDAHHHVWDLSVRPQPWTDELPAMRRTFTLSDLEPDLDAHRIDGTVVVQTVNVAEETPELLALAAKHPRVRGVVGWVDLTAPDVPEQVARLRDLPGGERLVGVRHQVQYETGDWLARPDVRRGLGLLADLGLVYELVVTADQLCSVVGVVTALPDVRFVLDHAAKPAIARGLIEPWATRMLTLAGRPNITGKLSGLVTEAGAGWTTSTLRPYVETLACTFGPSRLMFGSDWPVCGLAATYDEVVAADEELTSSWSTSEREALFGGTATSVYGLS